MDIIKDFQKVIKEDIGLDLKLWKLYRLYGRWSSDPRDVGTRTALDFIAWIEKFLDIDEQ